LLRNWGDAINCYEIKRTLEISDNLKEHNAIKYKEQSVLTVIRSEFLAIDRLD